MFRANRFLAVIVLFFFAASMVSCGGGGGGSGSNSSGTTNLMEGAISPPDTVPETTTILYITEDGTSVNIEVVKGQVVVQFDPNVSESIADSLIVNNSGTIISKIPSIRYYLVNVAPGTEMNFITKMRQETTVIYAVPDYPTEAREFPNEWDGVSSLDPSRSFLEVINAPQAWNLLFKNPTSRLSEMEIGIIDSFKGLKDGLKDFEGRLQNDIPLVFPLKEYDHGTKVTALCCSTGNNGYGNVGVNWWSKIRLAGMNLPGVLTQYRIKWKLANLVNEGSKVINLSVGYVGNEDDNCSTKERDQYKIDYKQLFQTVDQLKKKQPNFLLIVAAGNDNCDLNSSDIPNKPDNVMIVGASDLGQKSPGSNRGTLIDIAAPDYINWYDYSSSQNNVPLSGGTSFAAPLVTGAAALVWANDAGLTAPQQVIQRLKSTANGAIPEFGGAGILDVYKALGGTEGPTDTTPPSIPTGLTATAISSSQIDLSWNASTDNVGVAGYKIYRGGTYLKSVTTTSTSDTGLTASTQYCYTVSAYDAARNESGQSIFECATTLSSGYSISGRVTSNGTGLAGVTITLTGSGASSTVTDSYGNYSFTGAQNGSYTITPSIAGYTFNPSIRTVTVNNADVTGQDFVATQLNGGGSINIVGNWNVLDNTYEISVQMWQTISLNSNGTFVVRKPVLSTVPGMYELDSGSYQLNGNVIDVYFNRVDICTSTSCEGQDIPVWKYGTFLVSVTGTSMRWDYTPCCGTITFNCTDTGSIIIRW